MFLLLLGLVVFVCFSQSRQPRLIWQMHFPAVFVDTSKAALSTIEDWETQLLDLFQQESYPDIIVYGSTGISEAQEISRQSAGDVTLLVVSYILMSLYMAAALGAGLPLRHSRALLGIGAVAMIGMAILASLGFTALFFRFNPLTVQV